MALLVKKFGGSSVATPEKMRHIASRVLKERNPDDQIVIVVSAMGDTTDNLLNLASKVTDKHYARELDMLMSTGEQVSIAMMAMTFCSMGVPAQSFTGPQAGIIAEGVFGKGNIIDIKPARVFKALAAGKIAIVAGFQAITPEGEIITLGRGGSDTTAVALAGAMKADMCEIYTDVEGVFTADPRKIKDARKLDVISYDEMLELATLGAQVLNNRSVEMAKKYGVQLVVRSSMNREEGTVVKEVVKVEKLLISGVASDKNTARISVIGIEDKPGTAFKIFNTLAKKNINVDIILQSVGRDGTKDISFTVAEDDLQDTLAILEENKEALTIQEINSQESVAKISIVGAGMMSNPGVAAKMFEALTNARVNIHMISTSEVRITVLINESDVERAINAVHERFGLGE